MDIQTLIVPTNKSVDNNPLICRQLKRIVRLPQSYVRGDEVPLTNGNGEKIGYGTVISSVPQNGGQKLVVNILSAVPTT